MYNMTRSARAKFARRHLPGPSEAVGTAEFRANLAKYLRQARTGRPVLIQERGRSAYVLSRLDEVPPSSIVGCMRERTECSSGVVVNAREQWRAGDMP
jgi:prevent-host-death family protein